VSAAIPCAWLTTVSAVAVGSKAVRLYGSCALAIVWLVAPVSSVLAEDVRAPQPSTAAAGPKDSDASATAGVALRGRDLPLGQYRFRVFAGAEGLRNLVITSIAQDGNGLLWLATDDGVYRFDGEQFMHLSLDHGLTSSAIYVVGVRPDGTVCAGSRGGLGCWDGERFSQETTQGLPGVPVDTMVTYGGKTWVGTDGGGLYVQGDGGVFVPAEGWPAPQATIRALWADANGLVVGDGATVQLSSGDGVWQSIGDVGIGGDAINAVLRDLQGALWIRTASHLWCLPPGAARASDVSDGLPTGYDVVNVPNAMALGPRGEVMVGTDVGIAYRESGRWSLIDHAVGMPAAAARTLFTDREGTLWIGAVGLFQLRGRGVIERYDVPSGMPGNIVWGFKRDREGTLWVGTNRCLARAIAGRWKCVDGTEGRVFRAIVFPPQGGVFAGGSPSDLMYIDPRGRMTALDFDRNEDRTILSLALGPDGDLWIGTSLGMFRLAHAVPGPIERVEIPRVKPSGRFAAIAVFGDEVWTATDEGILVLDRGAWHLFNTKSGFRSAAMRRVLRRADGQMCASYSEAVGVVCFRYDHGAVSQLHHIGPEQGLTTGMAYFLGEDRQQRLWIGTGDGVDVVTAYGIDHFDDSDGLAGNDSAATAFLADGDGSLWLGSTGGATHVLAQYYDGPPHPPRTAFINGRLGDRSIIKARGALEVPHDRSALTLEFASSSMLDPKRVEYQTRLSPIETEWSVSHQRFARYPALLPGSYHFEVRARLGAGSWGPATELRFAVLPAWWQTGWFLVVMILAGLALIGGLFALRQRAVLRRRTRQLHERTDASFRAVIDLMPDMISVLRDGKLIYLNQASRRFLGLQSAREQWDAHDLNARIHPDDFEAVSELFRKVGGLDTPVSDVVEIRMRGGDGGWRICEVSAVRVEIGGAPTVVSSGRDVTERKRMRAKLLVSDRMASLGTLAAGIAHEINNPLSYVAGNLEAMAETLQAAAQAPIGSERAELTAAVEEARDGAERVRKIVQGLRSFSRSEEQEKRVPLALPGVLEAAIRLTANEVRHRAQLVRELGPIPQVIADDGRLTQVFINLLVNAAHAIPEGHSDDNRITVRTRTDVQGRAVIEVEDTGEGMPPEVQARVFDPFFTTKDVGVGTGLGLSICHGIVSGLGGQIAIESAPDHGTVVRVILPPVEGEAGLPVALALVKPETNGHRRHRVMLVDDEPLVVHTIERLLRRDYDITVALCGQEAVAHIARGMRFDAIVTDVMMPNMTGIELIEEVRRLAPDQADRIIFLSGGAFTAQTRERLDQLGVPQLEKPVTAKELRACVMRVATERGGRS
jgi:PAS domain S-box-containing protein